MNTTAPSSQLLRARCKSVWESGDFGVVARHIETAAAEFMAHLSLQPKQRVLDLACGTGNLALIAARAGCRTSGLDIAANLIAQARVRAQAEHLDVEYMEGDADALPYPDETFDLVVSMFGVMFAPRPEQAAAEFLRVCRSQGTIALAHWTPAGFIGENFRTVARHIPPPPDVPSPLLWGDASTVQARLGAHVSSLSLTPRIARMRFPFPPAQAVDFFRQFYGPTLRAFATLDSAGQARLHADLEKLFRTHNQATDGSTEVHAEYLQIVAVRR